MTLDEANSALRLYNLKLSRIAGESFDWEDHKGIVYWYTVTTPHQIVEVGRWDKPIQEIYEWVLEHFA